jgi:hypothetical protein
MGIYVGETIGGRSHEEVGRRGLDRHLAAPGPRDGDLVAEPGSTALVRGHHLAEPILTAQFWNPIIRYVSEKSGVPLQLKVAQTGPEHTAMVRRGEYHFLYSNHNFIKENEESGYRVFGRSKDDLGTGEIVVLKDSPIKSLAELQGQEVAFPHTAAFLRLPPADGRPAPQGNPGQGGLRRQPGRRDGPAQGRARRRRRVNAAVMQAFAQRGERGVPHAVELGQVRDARAVGPSERSGRYGQGGARDVSQDE